MLIGYFSFEHDITGTRTADVPLETLGGILADDLGLGKTLTVLSTILRTAKMSKSYAEENNESIAVSKGNEISSDQVFSRATLVIVPSSRKCIYSCHEIPLRDTTDINSPD
jgi:SWI/SNF-related matrix-associated actin-dependent regulator of chromatin subfamily A3